MFGTKEPRFRFEVLDERTGGTGIAIAIRLYCLSSCTVVSGSCLEVWCLSVCTGGLESNGSCFVNHLTRFSTPREIETIKVMYSIIIPPSAPSPGQEQNKIPAHRIFRPCSDSNPIPRPLLAIVPFREFPKKIE